MDVSDLKWSEKHPLQWDNNDCCAFFAAVLVDKLDLDGIVAAIQPYRDMHFVGKVLCSYKSNDFCLLDPANGPLFFNILQEILHIANEGSQYIPPTDLVKLETTDLCEGTTSYQDPLLYFGELSGSQQSSSRGVDVAQNIDLSPYIEDSYSSDDFDDLGIHLESTDVPSPLPQRDRVATPKSGGSLLDKLLSKPGSPSSKADSRMSVSSSKDSIPVTLMVKNETSRRSSSSLGSPCSLSSVSVSSTVVGNYSMGSPNTDVEISVWDDSASGFDGNIETIFFCESSENVKESSSPKPTTVTTPISSNDISSSVSPKKLRKRRVCPTVPNSAKCVEKTRVKKVTKKTRLTRRAAKLLSHGRNLRPRNPKTGNALKSKDNYSLTGYSRQLWEFLRDLLESNQYQDVIAWEDRSKGVFELIDQEKLAELWGVKKANPNMTYEKMSRALRHYYKSKIVISVPGRRLVYKFGRDIVEKLRFCRV